MLVAADFPRKKGEEKVLHQNDDVSVMNHLISPGGNRAPVRFSFNRLPEVCNYRHPADP